MMTTVSASSKAVLISLLTLGPLLFTPTLSQNVNINNNNNVNDNNNVNKNDSGGGRPLPTFRDFGGVSITQSSPVRWMTIDICPTDNVTIICDVDNTDGDSNICSRDGYSEFWSWNLTYGVKPQDQEHTLNLNTCRASDSSCSIMCDCRCKCIRQTDGSPCTGGCTATTNAYNAPPQIDLESCPWPPEPAPLNIKSVIVPPTDPPTAAPVSPSAPPVASPKELPAVLSVDTEPATPPAEPPMTPPTSTPGQLDANVKYFENNPPSYLETLICPNDNVTFICDVGNTHKESNICNRADYMEFWSWNLTYGVVPDDLKHTLNLNECRFDQPCTVQCHCRCRCIRQSDGTPCDGGCDTHQDGFIYLPPPTNPPPCPWAADESLSIKSAAFGPTSAPGSDMEVKSVTTAPTSAPTAEPKSSLEAKNLVMPTLAPTPNSNMAIKSVDVTSTKTKPFSTCFGTTAVVTCTDPSLNLLIDHNGENTLCNFEEDEFLKWIAGTSPVNKEISTLSMDNCQLEGGCSMMCHDSCTCLTSEGDACGKCAAEEEDSGGIGIKSIGGGSINRDKNFVACPNETAIVTCSNSTLVAMGMEGQPFGDLVCDFDKSDFHDWMASTCEEDSSTSLTMMACKHDGNGICPMKCDSSCICKNPDGTPCGEECSPSGTTIKSVIGSVTDPSTIDYKSSFMICNGDDAIITCSGAALEDSAECQYTPTDFASSQQKSTAVTPFELTLGACGMGRCAVGCQSETCTCRKSDGSPCGICTPSGIAVKSVVQTSTTVEHTDFVAICADTTAIITCEDPLFGQIYANDKNVSPDQLGCDFTASDYNNWKVISTVTPGKQVLTLEGCNDGEGTMCAAKCNKSCVCRTLDGGNCGDCNGCVKNGMVRKLRGLQAPPPPQMCEDP